MRKIVALALLCLLGFGVNAQVNINAPWTWVNGEKHIPMRPVIGIKNVSAPANSPGGRKDAVSWTDQNGIVWVFGGYGYGAIGEGFFNDLWKYNSVTNEWTWVSGDNNVNGHGVYGTQGVPDDANLPGSRMGSCSWLGNDGNFYLFGGDGFGANARGRLNDLWKYNPLTNQWAWLSGPATLNTTGIYGTQGITNASNWPGARVGGTLWKGDDNIIWLFGGYGYAMTGTMGRLNDIWKYDPLINQWTWMNGSSGINAVTTTNMPGGRSTGKTTWKDDNGNLYLFGGATGSPYTALGDFWKYNTATNVWTNLTPSSGMFSPISPEARYNGLTWKDNAGNFWLFGGFGRIRQSSQSSVSEEAHLNSLWKYNLLTGLWTRVNGDIYYTALFGNYGIQGIPNPANRRGGRESGITWIDPSGKLWSFGGEFREEVTPTYRNDIWSYDPVTNLYTWIKGDSMGNVRQIYGVPGIADPANRPGERVGSGTWADNNANLWLFGGEVRVFQDGPGFYFRGDLMKYNISSGQWALVPAPATRPMEREFPATWKDGANNFWMFGGGHGNSGSFNDLWRYDPALNQWTFMHGINGITSSGGSYGTQGIASPTNVPSARRAAAHWMDNSGNVWIFGGDYNWGLSPRNDLWKYNPASNQWTWVKGANTVNAAGVYGILGMPAATNTPGARGATSAAWTDNAGNLWMFGGGQINTSTQTGGPVYNDLWKYDIASNQWIWMGGDNTPNGLGIYGTKGTASASNKPGARFRPVSWTDANGNFWLMGGEGVDAGGVYGKLNDMWMYNPVTNQWTWVKGEATINNNGIYGTKGIPNALNNPGARYGTASWKDGAGDVWIYGGYGFAENGQDRLSDLWKISSPSLAALPVHLLEFKGRLINNDGVLNWKTENELNAASFIIERSTDRRNYVAVGTKNPNNISGMHQYDFTDPGITSLGAPVVYYRLKQKDFDGKASYSNIIALTMDKSLLVFFYPNPVVATANITVTTDKSETVQVKIINATGAVVKQLQWKISAGSTSLSLDLDVLASGAYYLDLSGEKISKRIPFMKQ